MSPKTSCFMSACTKLEAPYLATLHVLHVETVLALFSLLVFLLLAAAFFDYAEATGEYEQCSHHSDGNQSPWRNCQFKNKTSRINIHFLFFWSSEDFFKSLQLYVRGILSISFRNLLLISSNMSFLLISVLLEPEVSGAEVENMVGEGAMVPVGALEGLVAVMACDVLNKLNFIFRD